MLFTHENYKISDISFIFFALQLFRSIYNYIRPYFTTNPDVNYLLQLLVPVIADVYAWTGSISLIILRFETDNF